MAWTTSAPLALSVGGPSKGGRMNGLKVARRVQCPQEGGEIVAADAVGEIEACALRCVAQQSGDGQPVAGPGLWLQIGEMAGGGGGVGHIGQSRRRVGDIPRGGEQRDAAILRLGGGDDALRGGGELRPGGGGGPAIIDDQQYRTAAGQNGRRAQRGAGKADDEQGGREHPEQQHPERQPVGSRFGVRQVAQQGDRREAQPARRRRREAQNEIQSREQDERRERQGGGKDHWRSNALYKAASAWAGGWSVRWKSGVWPASMAAWATFSRCAAMRAR